jgi:hypothetical protein
MCLPALAKWTIHSGIPPIFFDAAAPWASLTPTSGWAAGRQWLPSRPAIRRSVRGSTNWSVHKSNPWLYELASLKMAARSVHRLATAEPSNRRQAPLTRDGPEGRSAGLWIGRRSRVPPYGGAPVRRAFAETHGGTEPGRYSPSIDSRRLLLAGRAPIPIP